LMMMAIVRIHNMRNKIKVERPLNNDLLAFGYL
jgi:hypothetical protein